ncbi:MAG: WYL domain-containing protein [Bacteroidales bacterium]|nr:WYL domain-containing protein [Bacteroidales bacterium]MCD8394762.1 WYL domain-containing protein [Bacteroidales bacterium]
MPVNRNTIVRLRTIDRCLQRGRQCTLQELNDACYDALNELGYAEELSLRTTQRDIQLLRSSELGYNAPIVVRERKYYSYEDPKFSIRNMPLSERDLQELSSALDIFRHYQGFRGLGQQEDLIARLQESINLERNQEPIVWLDTNERLRGLEHLSTLYDLIRDQKPIVVSYQSFRQRTPGDIQLSPYLLKEFNNRWFVIGHPWNGKAVMTLALDRICAVREDKDNPYVPNTFFRASEYIGQMVGVTRDPSTRPRHVTLWVDAETLPYMITKPLHGSQMLTEKRPDGSGILHLEVILNFELERLLLGFAEHLEVLAPRELRHRVSQHILMASTRYLKS